MLKAIEKVFYQPPHSCQKYSVQFDGKVVQVESASGKMMIGRVEEFNEVLQIHVLPFNAEELPSVVLSIAFDCLFGHFQALKKVIVRSSNEIVVSRQEFYQHPGAWHRRSDYSQSEETWTTTDHRKHPVRPQMELGTHYRRYVPSIQKTISFRTIDIERDLKIFHEWHSQSRVADLWDLNKPMEELRVYLEKGLSDPHQIPMMLEFDGEPSGYFEIYWAAEDRLGPYYDYLPFDRGFHFLIGNPKFLGRENTGAVVRSVMHMIYLDEARTSRIVAEPRSDNERVLKYVQLVPGWKFIKEFDFPHKKAALLMARREDFFSGGAL